MLEAMLEADARVLVPATEALIAAGAAAGGPLSGPLTVESVRRDERRRKLGLDAMIGCYLKLKGGDGLDLIDRRFLADPDADQTHVYSALMALRFLAEEGDIVPHERLLASARLLLNNELFADQVIPDLARWEDWSLIERLGEMFELAEDGTPSEYVRDPIVTYLDVASEQSGEVGDQATALIAKLEATDPETFRRARSLQAFGFLGSARREKRDPPAEDAAELEAMAEESDALDSELVDSDLSDDGANGSDAFPDPSTFGVAANEPDEATDGAIADPGEAAPSTAPTGPAAPTGPTEQVAAKPVIPAGAEPLTPPSRLVLLGVPVVAAAACFGLFWLILRGGAA